MIIADTGVLIDFLAGTEPGASRVGLEMERGELRTTTVTRFGLLSEARSTGQLAAIRRFLEALPPLPLDSASADRAADVRRALEKDGHGIGMGDSLIAGIVLAANGVLLTRNRRHFERVEGLRLGDVA